MLQRNTTIFSCYPFGMAIPGRTFSNGTQYRYGFNGQEKSDEIDNGLYTAQFWEYDSRIGRRWNLDPKPQFGLSEYAAFNNNPIFFLDGKGDLVKVYVSNQATGYTMINLYSAKEVAKGYKQVQVKVPVYLVTVTNESGKFSTFYYTRYNNRANIKNNNAIEDRTFDVNKDGDHFPAVIKNRNGFKQPVLELRNPSNTDDQHGVIGMNGDVSNVERVAIEFHILGASDGCLLAVSNSNLLPGSSAKSNYPNSGAAQAALINTVKSYQAEDQQNGFSNSIDVTFGRLHDNPNYVNDRQCTSNLDGSNSSKEWHAPMIAPAANSSSSSTPSFLNISPKK